MSRRFFTIVVTFVVALGAAAATAQNVTGVVSGLIRDSLGGAIPGATVRAVNEACGTSVEAVSDGQGSYRFVGLASGEYRVEAVLDGFETATRKVVLDAGQTVAIDLTLAPARINEGVVVTARRVEEEVQEVPIPVSVLSGELDRQRRRLQRESRERVDSDRSVLFVQSAQFVGQRSAAWARPSASPTTASSRVSACTSTASSTPRPAAATLDFLDVERVEVLRGPQGTLFGKNTTAGAINVTSRKPGFKPRAEPSSATAASTSCRRRPRSPGLSAELLPDGCRSPGPAAMAFCSTLSRNSTRIRSTTLG